MRYNRYLLILPPPLSGSTLRATRQRSGCSPQRGMPRRSVNRERDQIVKCHTAKISELFEIEHSRMCLFKNRCLPQI